MATATIKKFSDLKKRVGRFLNSEKYGRDEVKTFIRKLEPLGQVAIFGGMLRDLSIRGNQDFKSDIDLVIKTSELDKLRTALNNYNVATNKFGGYRIKLNKWEVDLWSFESTWAFQEGLVEGKQLKDLCKTTFFNWDSIIYDLSSGSIHAIDGYLDKINERFLDINLPQNLNPIGNIIKTLRYYELYNAKLSPRLADFIFQNIKHNISKELIYYEKHSHQWPILDKSRTLNILNSIKQHQQQFPQQPFEQDFVQETLINCNKKLQAC